LDLDVFEITRAYNLMFGASGSYSLPGVEAQRRIRKRDDMAIFEEQDHSYKTPKTDYSPSASVREVRGPGSSVTGRRGPRVVSQRNGEEANGNQSSKNENALHHERQEESKAATSEPMKFENLICCGSGGCLRD